VWGGGGFQGQEGVCGGGGVSGGGGCQGQEGVCGGGGVSGGGGGVRDRGRGCKVVSSKSAGGVSYKGCRHSTCV
jgi:hypothetical protein